MARLEEKHIDIMKDLYYDKGYSYHDISLLLKDMLDIEVADDTVRYHVTRKDKPKLTLLDKLQEDGISKKLILSDLHIPYHRADVLEIVEKHKDEIDEIIINGDITDCAEISSFEDVGKYTLIEEMIATHGLLKEIDNITPNIKKKINFGNHETRFRRYLAKYGNSLTSLHSTNILKEICGGFTDHDHIRGTETYYEPLVNYTVIDDWWHLVNDVVIAHPISFSKIKGRTATLSADYFIQYCVDFSAIIIGHTHKWGQVSHYDKICIESGCLCQPMSYSTSGKITYSPQDYGYVLAVFKDGKFDVNESRLYKLKELK